MDNIVQSTLNQHWSVI